mmetsp:Transcript_139000/g.432419  ORF Transcript_139000/g.432419 Transcript_139000/m.432419 type:complete len:279 (-) Transcript_139000:1011-1847(-)
MDVPGVVVAGKEGVLVDDKLAAGPVDDLGHAGDGRLVLVLERSVRGRVRVADDACEEWHGDGDIGHALRVQLRQQVLHGGRQVLGIRVPLALPPRQRLVPDADAQLHALLVEGPEDSHDLLRDGGALRQRSYLAQRHVYKHVHDASLQQPLQEGCLVVPHTNGVDAELRELPARDLRVEPVLHQPRVVAKAHLEAPGGLLRHRHRHRRRRSGMRILVRAARRPLAAGPALGVLLGDLPPSLLQALALELVEVVDALAASVLPRLGVPHGPALRAIAAA